MGELTPDPVILRVNGRDYGGWKEVSIRRSLDASADTFDLKLTDKWVEAMERRPVVLGSPCQVWLGREKLITGYVDDVEPGYDDKTNSLAVKGRSKVADLIDCSYPVGGTVKTEYNNRTLAEMAAILAEPLGITVRDMVRDTTRRDYALEQSEPVFEVLASAAKTIGVRLVSDADGNLVISRSSSQRVSTPLVLGENIRRASGRFSMRDRFSHYYFPGQRPGNDDTNGEAAAHVMGRSEDLRVRYRPTVVLPETDVSPAEAKRQAEWRRNVSYGRSRQVTYTVSGWRHAEDIWRPNRLVRIRDPRMGIIDKWWMVATVRFVLDGQGRRTELTVMPEQAFDLIPLPDDAPTTWDQL